jgi:hypothetical protein
MARILATTAWLSKPARVISIPNGPPNQSLPREIHFQFCNCAFFGYIPSIAFARKFEEPALMSGNPGQSNIVRSIWSVAAGFIVVLVVYFGSDYIVNLIAGFPKLGEVYTDKQFLWAANYRTLYGIIGSYVTAALAPTNPMKHALIGGAIGFALNLLGTVATWNHVPSLGPHWYPLSLLIGTFPTAWLGARLRILQFSSR